MTDTINWIGRHGAAIGLGAFVAVLATWIFAEGAKEAMTPKKLHPLMAELDRLRAEAGEPVGALARRLGLPYSTTKAHFDGSRQPTIDRLEVYAAAYDRGLSFLARPQRWEPQPGESVLYTGDEETGPIEAEIGQVFRTRHATVFEVWSEAADGSVHRDKITVYAGQPIPLEPTR